MEEEVKAKKTTEKLISCLKNEKVSVLFIPRESSLVKDPKHILYGGLAEGATISLTVPMLESSKTFINVLTNSEKVFLENIMGLEPNALSVYLTKNNFWDNYCIRLNKNKTVLDLSVPYDYIKYKVLLANKDVVAPSVKVLTASPKATYKFVIVAENEENNKAAQQLSETQIAYKALGKIEDDIEKLRFIVSTLTNKPLSVKTTKSFLEGEIYKIIQTMPRMFVDIVKDELFETKLLINQAIENGVIVRRGENLYLAKDNSPLCENNEDPTMEMAAIFLNAPKRQSVRFYIETQLKK